MSWLSVAVLQDLSPTTTSPFSVNLTALLQKLIRICPSRSGSPSEMGRHRGLDVEDELQPLGRRLLGDQVADVLQHLVEIEVNILDRELPRLDLREIKDVVDDAEEVLARALDLRT